MVSHESLSNSKFILVSNILLCTLADLNNTVVWMVSTRPLISKSSSPRTNHLEAIPSAIIKISITVTSMFHSFLVHWQSLGTYLSFRFLSVLSCGQQERQCPLFSSSCFFLFFSFFFFFFGLSLGLVVKPKLDDSFVSQNSKEFWASHFLEWILNRVYTICLYGQLFAQFPVGYLAHPVMSSLILSLCQFTTIAYYVNDCSVSCYHIICFRYFLATCLFLLRHKSKVGNLSWGQPEGSLFTSYYTEM